MRVHQKEKNHNGTGCTLNVDIYESGLHPAFRDDGLHLPGDVIEAVVGWGGYLDCSLHTLQFSLEIFSLTVGLSGKPYRLPLIQA